MTHQLKTVQPFFDAVRDGKKTAELRKDDRGFQIGDVLVLREYDAKLRRYSGASVTVVVTHVLRDFEGLAPWWVMLSFRIELPKDGET